jgi:hypothetical protein
MNVLQREWCTLKDTGFEATVFFEQPCDYGKHGTGSGSDFCGRFVSLKNKMCVWAVAGQIKVMFVLEKEGSKRKFLLDDTVLFHAFNMFPVWQYTS